MRRKILNRRRFLIGGLGLTGAVALGGCDRLPSTRAGQTALQAGEDASKFVQRLLLTPQTLAHEFTEADISDLVQAERLDRSRRRRLRSLGRRAFRRLQAEGRRPGREAVRDLARRAARFAVAHADHPPRLRRGLELHRQMDGRAAAATLLQRAGLKPQARYVVFRCFDSMDSGSLDSDEDGRATTKASISSTPIIRRRSSPTTMNGAPLTVAARRAAAAARRAAARLQDAQISESDRSRRQFRRDRRRPRRLLGGSGLRLVRRASEPRPRGRPAARRDAARTWCGLNR